MTRDTALITTIARVVQLTGQQDLVDLESTTELSVSDLLLTAHQAVYDRLERDGIDPTKITNDAVFERAMAFEFLGILAASDYLGQGTASATEESELRFNTATRYYEQVRPKVSQGEESRRAGEGIPLVLNADSESFIR